eukprot:TRINITY_DN52641_c0_g1_i1.p1 TRINITY_DN52641_c0_g1~~TRINITY_DN52641_c0_g1_i1.p1  ORF type:complete len:807 (+),score=96.56 TRINITY_DN52641_c0_g1_i1:258-2423(+)
MKINPEKKKQALNHCRMNKEDSSFIMRISEDGLQAVSRDQRGWGGCRANYGVTEGKFYYEATIMDDGLARVGWATVEASLELGTDREGFGYGGTAKKSFAKQFDDYGIKFGRGDIVGCMLNRDANEISFSVNGKDMGAAFSPIPSALKQTPMYPCLCVKNCHISLNFGGKALKYPPAGYTPMAALKEDLASQEKLYEQFLRLKEAHETGGGHHASALIIEPTLELAQQVADELNKFIKFIEDPTLKYSLIVGRRDIGTIMKELNNGVDIIVGTPGRLKSLVGQRQINLSNCQYFVMDEADRLSGDNLDIILGLYNAIKTSTKHRVQVCMFSATLHSPEITNLYKQICPNASWVDLKGRDYVPDTVHHGVVYVNPDDPTLKQAAAGDYSDDLVHQGDNLINNHNLRDSLAVKRLKVEMVQKLIDAYKMDQCLIFCRTRLDCDNLKDFLDKKGGGRKFTGKVEKGKENPYACVALHSGYSPRERQENLDMFKDGDVRILICTDVAARGIDIKELPYVINVTLPDKDEDYIHRVGRVGRADRMGLAITLASTVKEKVWYHQCPSRGEGCTNRKLLSEGGCCIWYDEPTYLKAVEARIKDKVPEMDKQTWRHPAHKDMKEEDGKIVYGKTKAEANQGVSEHVLSIMSDVEQLQQMELNVQSSFLNLNGIVHKICYGDQPRAGGQVSGWQKGKKSGQSSAADVPPEAPRGYTAHKKAPLPKKAGGR